MGQQTTGKESFKVESAMGIIKQRSLPKDFLQENKKSHDISISNRQAAESAPRSLTLAEEFLRTINKLDHKY